LDNGVRLLGQADLLIRAESEADGVIIEVHDFEPAPWVRAGLASRDLRVVSAVLAQPPSGHDQSTGVDWKRLSMSYIGIGQRAKPSHFEKPTLAICWRWWRRFRAGCFTTS
ncbi:MAG: hypothetical protein ABI847_06725, partial [Anaerolineales bacterium]